ncbi:PK1L2 protein, partial [Amia calva]|nr:PK1L2 protein [Amia calva]
MPIKTQGCEAWCVSRGVALDGQEAPACPDFQKGFDGSCYEFVGLQRSFLSAQGWCERGGGHLAFVLNDETQQFLQKHLAPNQDWWIGLAPASQNLTLQIPGAEGPLSWLDGSDVSFSNWHKEPQTGPHCGHILRDSGFQWEATNNCTEEFHFVCQFELDRTLACVDHNATLQCGSGQVIEIDDSFYGRKTLHYCQLLTPPSASPPQEECSWVDVVELVSGHCHGLQVCQAAADMASFGEPCPGFGSYLSVEYHCKEGLKLEVVDPAAVFENVTIGIKWLLKPFSGNLTCTLGTGDGHTIDPYSPVSLESSVIHSYTRPGIYTVTVECTTSEWYVTAQKAITIQEPIGDFGIVRCYSMNHSGESGNCRALYGSTLQIQVELDAGTNITYKVQTGSDLLATLTAMRGINPHNITIDSMAKQQLGPGSHRLTILASNAVSASEVSMALDVLFVEPILGLQASVVSEGALSMGSDIQVSVSVSHGAPLQLHFKITGANESFSETRQMDVSKLQVFNLPVRFQGTLLVTVRATNGFSQMDVEAGNVTVISNIPETNTETTDSDEEKASKTRAVRNGQDFQIKESHNMPVETDSKVTLEAVNFGSDGDYTFKWSCVDGCWPQMKSCQDALDNSRKQLEITPECLPDPYTIVAVNVTATNTGNTNPQTAVSCIAVTAAKHLTLDIKCTENCGPVDKSKAVRLTLSCSTCPKIRWYFEDQNNTDWVTFYSSLSLREGQQANDLVVSSSELQTSKSNIKVKALGISGTQSGSADYTIKLNNPGPTNNPNTSKTTTAASAPISTASTDTMTKADLTSLDTTTHSLSTADVTAAPTPAIPPSLPSCTICPSEGTTLTPFTIDCTGSTCAVQPCIYCFKTGHENFLYCGLNQMVQSLYLPLGNKNDNFTQIITVTVTNRIHLTSSSPVFTRVRNATTGISVNGLHSLLSQQVSSLQQEANLGTMLAHMYQSVLTEMNINSDVQEKSQRVEMRQQMINNLTSAFQISSAKSIEDIQQAAGAIMAITDRSDELTPTAVIQAFDFIEDLSQSLLFYNVSESHVQRGSAIERIVKAASSVLEASYQISGHVVRTVDNVQSALLAGRQLNQKASTLSTPQISLYVNRVSPDQIHGQVFNVKNASSAHFTLPLATASALPTNESIDVRMVSLGMNPYSWSEGESISGIVGGLSLTRENGSTIPVSNLTAEIEILLPRPKAGVVNSTILHLSNYSTIMVNMTVTNISLVLKLEPSEDIPMQLLLGFLYHPNDTHNDAETQLPHSGSTMEEKYTWVLGPNDLPQEIGVYYLLVRPIVKAGVNSTNATVSVTSITTQCVHWDEVKSNWSTQGCRVGPLTTPQVTQCLCTHLTFFGSSFFVMPNVVDISRTTELFATFADNPVVVCFVGAIFVVYILFVIWARRKDIKDAAKVKITVLEDNDPLAQYRYMLTVCTGHRRGAATSSQVTVTLLGSEGQSEPHHLTDSDKPVFERGGTDMFLLTTPFSLGELQSIRLWHDNSGDYPAWYINKVIVHDLETDQKWHFLCSCWLAIDVGDCVLDKVFPVATEMDLKKFSNLFFMKTANDFGDGHIWYSVLSRPPRSNFTCVQRVSCCLSLLLCTMLTSIMFWGIPKDPSEQKMDLGKIEFTWQQVMIGIQSSVIMFPINLLIVSIFRNTCPREKKSEQPSKQAKPEPAKQGKSGRVTPSQPPSPQSVHRDITPDSVIKDIKRIAQSLSKVMKSPVPQLEKDFGRTTDINKLLSMVEEIIRLQNRAGGDFYTETRKKEGSLVLTLGAVNLQESTPSGSPERTSIDGQKRSNYSLYLYRQLQHVEKELQLLGPTRFKPPQSYRQAMQQVQGMKGLLESHLSEQDRQGLSGSPSPAENSTRKKCCQNGLPWWFVFIGWFLVVATSGMSGFYTMLYGLKYGKDRSVSWLISMTVSFFESLFITQPLKVLGFAAFFALVLKKVDVDEGSEVAIEGTLSNPGDPGAVLSTRRDSTCSFYQPPPPTDIERMRNNMIKEQKVFALIREILAYIGFLWMLLLVAYGQRDPHAFFLTQHIEKSFTSGTSDSMSHQDVFTWVNTTVLSNLFGQYPGFITDGNSKLVGSARMRQVRVRRDSCPVAKSMRGSIPDCHAPYSWDLEDMGLYGPGWNTSTLANNSQAPKAWQYQSQGTLRAHPIWGSVALYRGGGYVADLGPDLQSATSVLQYLFDNTWLDVYTRAVFVEFTVYNANINLFCIVTLSMETTAVGAFQLRSELQSVRLYQSSSGMNVFVMASEVIYFLFILYYMFVQGKRIKEQKWAYFHSKCNLLELAIITLSWSALSVFIKRTLLGNQDVEYYQLHRDQFVSFYETAAADAVLGYLIAFLVLLATVKLWHLLRLNPKLHMITSTLQRAWTDISGFIIVMIIMFLSYSIAFNLIFGWKLYSYRTLLEAAQTIVSLQLGIFNYDEVLDFNPVLGAFLVGSCIIFMTFVVLNLFISVILVAFSEEQKTHKVHILCIYVCV